MRSVRILLGSLGLAAAMAGCDSGGLVLANNDVAGVWVQVSPGSIQPGFEVTVRASCGDINNGATVMSKAFRSLDLEPGNSGLKGKALVPTAVKPGTYAVDLLCRTGSTAMTTLTVVGSTSPATAAATATVGPHTGGGYLAGHPGAANSAVPESAVARGERARVWLVGGLTALAAAIGIGIASLRRRRAGPR